MKRIMILLTLFSLVVGCTATPLDPLIPARRPSPATTEYLGHLYQSNAVNGMYYSVSDATINKELVGIRKLELEGLYVAAEGETRLYYNIGNATSIGVYGAVVGIAGLLGWRLPRPKEKVLVTEALHKKPPPRT